MTKESKIKESQQAQLVKAVQERDLFLNNPQMIEDKAVLATKIRLTLYQIQSLEDELFNKKDELSHLAEQAIELETKGIFWAEKDFSVCHAAKRKNEKAMLAQCPIDQINELDQLTKEAKDLKTQLLKSVKTIYLESKPSIKARSKTEANGDQDYDFE